MATGSPVRGLRPVRAARLRVANFPKPAIVTGSPRASASAMAENTTPTRRSASARGHRRPCRDVRDEFVLVHLLPFPMNGGRVVRDGALRD